MNALKIKTPEGVEFSFALAGPIVRCLARVLDILVVAAGTSIATVFVRLLGVISLDFASALYILAGFAISIGYGIAMEWAWRGQTIGKRLLRLRVMDQQGLRLQFNQVVIRNLFRAIDFLPGAYFVGGLSSVCSRRFQRLGDLAAGTVVIRAPKTFAPDLDQITLGKFNSLRAYRHLEARLRQQISPAEASVLLQAILRRDQLGPAARVTLFAELAERCRGLVRFPPEATESIADEQYVRNVVEILFRPQSTS